MLGRQKLVGMVDMNITSLFKGNNGKWSMMRLLSFVVTLSCLPVLYVSPEQSTPVCALIGAAIAGKWLQQKGES